MHLIMMFVELGILLLLSEVLSQGPPPAPPEPECDLILGPSVMVADDPKSLSFFNTDGMKILRPDDHTAVVTGFMEFRDVFKANFMASLEVSKEKMGKMQLAMTDKICDMCKEMNDPDSKFKMELATLGFPRECPFEAGKYDVYNFTLNTEEMPIEPANEGQYEIKLCIHEALDEDCYDTDLRGCVLLTFSIECS